MTLKRTRISLLMLSILFATSALISCNQTLPTQEQSRGKAQKAIWPRLSAAFAENEAGQAVEDQIEALLEQMSLAQKVGQITQVEFTFITPEEVRDYHIGALLNGGGAFLNDNKQASLSDWLATIDQYHLASMDTSQGGLAIPIIWGTDAIHGHNKIFEATLFPHNIGLGATRNADLARQVGALTALQVKASGMDWTYAPALAVPRDDRWGRVYESFAEDPALVAQMAEQMILGYQGDLREKHIANADHIAATAKHYLADGGTVDGIDRGNNYDSEAELIRYHAYPYFAAIQAGVLAVMASHSSWNGQRLHGQKYLLTNILKKRLGFDGAVVGDWNSHGMIDGCTNSHCPEAINAGVDMLMVPAAWREYIANTIADVEQGRISMARLNDAVRRVLRMKFRSGLMSAGKPSERPHAGKQDLLNGPQLKALARQAVRESLVLLKNNHRILPLAPRQRVLVTGEAANNLAQQNGGWTLSWQARNTDNADFPQATSIYAGIKEVVEQSGGLVELSRDASYRTKPDVAIVIFGEQPYAEWQGDLDHLGFESGVHQHAKLLERLQAQGIPTVSVFISGRPLWVNRELNASDAFVAAWLPGTEGGGIADVLFADDQGQARFDFKGVLPYSWPSLIEQSAVNLGDAQYQPLFPFGYGLNYSKARYLAHLPTDDSYALRLAQQARSILSERTHEPWEIYAVDEHNTHDRFRAGKAQAGALTLSAASDAERRNAVHGRWSGEQSAALQINVPNANRNLKQLLIDDGALQFDVKVIAAPSAPTQLELACLGKGCDASVDVTTALRESPAQQWQTHSVALTCFARQGLDFAHLSRAFSLLTKGSLEALVANVRYQPNAALSATIPCSPNTTQIFENNH